MAVLDEVALNILLAEGIDPTTAYAGSLIYRPQARVNWGYGLWQVGIASTIPIASGTSLIAPPSPSPPPATAPNQRPSPRPFR